jgi:DNA-directed RNA polymerase subunit beta
MSKLLANNYRFRRSFAKNPAAIDFDNLIAIQLRSYEEFLQADVAPMARRGVGLQAVFNSVFPITDFKKERELKFVYYELEEPKYDVDECREKGQSFVAQLKVCVSLSNYTTNEETGELEFNASIDEEVFFCDLPLMTQNGTFIINGTERVIVSQLYRSPGVFFSRKKLKNTSGIREVLNARIIPNRGSWIDFEFDAKDILHVQIDRRRKLPATILLRALGFTKEDLLSYFYDIERVYCKEVNGEIQWFKETPVDLLLSQTASNPIEVDGKVIVRKGKKILPKHLKKIISLVTKGERTVLGKIREIDVIHLPVSREYLYPNGTESDNLEAWPRMYSANTISIVDEEFEVQTIVGANQRILADDIQIAINNGITEFLTIRIDNKLISPALRDTLAIDKIDESPEEGSPSPIE